jgi:hypothetical protein
MSDNPAKPPYKTPYTLTEDPRKYRDWDRSQWAGESDEDESRAGDETAPEAPGPGGQPSAVPDAQWNKAQWAGVDAHGHRPEPEAPSEMEEGEHGRSGHRHTGEPAHWARPATESDTTET